ncbi:MAG: aminopeptidase, partial [bacterium]
VRHYTLSDGDPAKEAQAKRAERDKEPKTLSMQRNKPLTKLVDTFPHLKDFYNSFDDLNVSDDDKKNFEKYLSELKPEERELLAKKDNFYIVDLKNTGGLVMPVILKLNHDDGSTKELRIPAEIWAKDSVSVSKLII